MNGHMLGAGEPLRVRQGGRIPFRLLNASATENPLLALTGHSFKVIAMDGSPVPKPHMVSVLSFAVAERIDAIVGTNSPGLWIFGSTLAKERAMRLGIVGEYCRKTGAPVWRDAPLETRNFAAFASNARAPEPND
jgi:FtsP/CotA-like multicopper oxidase with cupredoxin domain